MLGSHASQFMNWKKLIKLVGWIFINNTNDVVAKLLTITKTAE